MNINEYGRRIKEQRINRGLNQQQLADALNVSAKTVSHWETGYTLPDVTMLKKIAEIFGITLNDLVNEKEDVPEKQIIATYSEKTNRFRRLNWFQKAVLIIVIAMTIVFTVIYGIVSQKEGYLYLNTILTPSSENGNTVYSGKIGDEQAVFTVSLNKTIVFQWGDDTYGPYVFREDPSAIPENHDWAAILKGNEIKCGEKTVFSGGVVNSSDGHRYLFNEDGTSADISILSSADSVPLEPSAAALVDLIYGPQLTHKGSLGIWFTGLVFCLATALSILFEDEIFRWHLAFRIRDYEHVEPSDWELFGRYVSWAIIPVLAFSLFMLGLQ